MSHDQYSAFAPYLPPVPLVEAWGDVVDVRQEQRDEWQQLGWGSGRGFSTGRSDDRRAGMLRPIYETEQDLDDIRAIARVLAETTAPGTSALLNLTNYVVGTGYTYRVTPEPRVDNEPLRKAVQTVVDEFLDRNNWCGELERELFRRSRRDGEYFLSMFFHDGQTEVRIVDPERVRDPQQVPPIGRCYSFGIDTEADDVLRTNGYWVFYDSLDGAPDYLMANAVQHVKLNVDGNIKRGVSDFFPIGSDIGNVRKLLSNMVKGGGIQAAIAYICEHAPGVTGTQIEGLIQTNATMRSTVPSYNTGTRTRYVNDERGGTRLDVGKGQTYKGSPLGNGEAANAFIAILQAGLRSIGSRWAMPEYMISGDASNANYASTKEAGTPFVKNCEVEQSQYKRRFSKTVWAAIKEACRAGRIEASYAEVCGQFDLQVEAPAIIVHDARVETERRAVLKREGILSAKTWSDQEGLDYEHEQANGAKQAVSPLPGGPVGAMPEERLREAAKVIWGNYP